MVSLARERLKPWSRTRTFVYQSDGSPRIPKPDRSFDRFVSTYVFDLLAPDFVDQLLSEAHRLLVPGGKICLVSLTFGASRLSRAVSWGWKRLWRLSPRVVGGCHPVELQDFLSVKEWEIDYLTRLTSWGITSEVIVGTARNERLPEI